MKIKPKMLCPITDWKEVIVTQGPQSGKTLRRRTWVGLNKFNFFLATETEGQEQEKWKQSSFFGTMRSLLSSIQYIKNIDMKYAVNNIIGELVKRTGKTPETNQIEPLKELDALGRWIDSEFGTNFLYPYPPMVYYNIFSKELNTDPSKITVDEDE